MATVPLLRPEVAGLVIVPFAGATATEVIVLIEEDVVEPGDEDKDMLVELLAELTAESDMVSELMEDSDMLAVVVDSALAPEVTLGAAVALP